MKKSLHLFVIVIFILLLSVGCSMPTSVEDALMKRNIKIDKIYSVTEYENYTVALYKESKTGNHTIGLFRRDGKKLSFIIQGNLTARLDTIEDLTFSAIMQDSKKNSPPFSLQFGIIKNPLIKDINLHMTGENAVEDRSPEIIEADGLRVWYTLLEDKRIFNIQEGISSEGKIIYSNRGYVP